MRSLLAGIAATAALCTAAYAADLPVRPSQQPVPIQTYGWSGFYLGLNGGFGWQRNDETLAGADSIASKVIATGAVPGIVATRGNGGLFGGTIGYNHQFSSVVVGLEADGDWSNIKGSGGQVLTTSPLGFPASLSTAAETKLKWQATLRARAGYLLSPSTLLYVTGGGAVGGIDNMTSIVLSTPIPAFNGTAASTSNSATKWGWTVGAGLEQRFWDHWSVKAEYRYVDLGSIDQTFGATVAKTPVNFTSDQKLQFHEALLGINYRF
jgi:outer membrane immunogenic protein